jgi:aspartyl-tRNA(Asn)/glutamyl-tRNA(Gln) amidotransferase subunit C
MAQKLTDKEVLHIAKLANLTLSEEEVSRFATQLSETLDYIAQLEKINIENTDPTFQTTGLTNVAREDEVQPGLTQEQALCNSKSRYNGYFKVKAIFEELNP